MRKSYTGKCKKRSLKKKDLAITEDGAGEADTEYQIQGPNAPEIDPSLMALQFQTDPAHVDQHEIKFNSSYIQFNCRQIALNTGHLFDT